MKTLFKKGFTVFNRKFSYLEELGYILKSDHAASKISNAVLSKINRVIKYTGKLPYYPTQITIEPTTACNYRCPSCFHGIEGGKKHLTGRDKFMDFENYKKFIDEIHKKVWFISLTGCGESFLHPDIYEMLDYACEKGLFVTLENNGSVFDPAKLAESEIQNVHFAIDCLSQDAYSKYRVGGDVENVLKRVLSYCNILEQKKKRPTVHLRFLVNRYTEDDYGKAEKMFNKFSFVRTYSDAFIIPADNLEQLKAYPSSTSFENYEKWHPRKYTQFNKYRYDDETGMMRDNNLFQPTTGSCTGVYSGAVLNTDGAIYPCCMVHATMPESMYYGNAFETGMGEVWNSAKARTFRTKYKKNSGAYALCKNCPNGRD